MSTLRNKEKTCNFGALTDKLITDRLVCGIDNVSERRVLLRESELTLAKTIEICKISELTAVHYNTRGRKAIVHRQHARLSDNNVPIVKS